MKHSIARRSIPWALSAVLALGTIPGPLVVLADGNGSGAASETSVSAVFRTPSIGKVSIGGSSYIELKDVRQLGNTVRFTLSVYNGGSSDLQFVDYWVRLRSASGSTFSPSLYDSDKDKNRIAPKTTQTFSFYAVVNDSTRLSDLAFDIIRWDFSLPPSYQRTLGSLKVPADYNPTTPAGSVLKTEIGGVSVNAPIKNVNLSRTSERDTASIVFEYENTGTKSLTIPAYEYAIVTPEGLMYPLTVTGMPEGGALHPLFKQELTLRGELPASLQNENWSLVLSEKQGTASNVPAMSFQLPASSSEEPVAEDVVPVGDTLELTVSDQTIEAKAARIVRNKNDRNYLASIRFVFVNKGTEPVTLPKYTFRLETSGGLTYPVSADLNNLSLDPLMEREIDLRATVPLSVGANDWTLVMHEPQESNASGIGSVLARFALSDTNPAELGQGALYDYTNETGTYRFQFNSLQRVPWEDEDILSAVFTVRNSSGSSLPVPNVAGYFMLDDKIKVDATVLQNDNVIALRPNAAITIQLFAKVPYTYEFSKLRVHLQEKSEGGAADAFEIADFAYTGDPAALRIVNVGQKHKIEGAGRQAELSIRGVRTYDGADYRLFTVLVDVKNLERRNTALAGLVGHFATEDGMIYPAAFTEVKDKVPPMGTATLLASTTIPASVDPNSLKLIIGEAVSGGKLVSGGGAADAYVNAVSFSLPAEPAEPANSLDNLTLFPYTLSMTNVRSRINTTESFIFSFDYSLTRNTLVTATGSDHTLIVEFTDKGGSIAFTKTFTLDKGDPSETNLALGNHNYSIEIRDPVLLYKFQYLTQFTLKVYDQYEGNKKLIAQTSFNW